MYRKIFFSGIIISVFFIGMLVDRAWLTRDNSVVGIVQEEEAEVPVFRILEIGDGYLTGEVTGGEIYVSAGEMGGANVSTTGEITVPLGDAFVNYEINDIPEGAQYVGSKNSNKYHPIGSHTSRQIAPENRVYFLTAEEAEAAGYVPIKQS